jgi:hypothetical protein
VVKCEGEKGKLQGEEERRKAGGKKEWVKGRE